MHDIKLIVIGCGRIGKMHVDIIQRHFNFVTITAVIDDQLDPDWALARGISHYHKNQLAALLASEANDAFLIAASSAEHASLIRQLAPLGKPIFCEKPISFDLSVLHELNQLTSTYQAPVHVGLNRRFDPDFSELQKRVKQGVVGDVHLIKVTNRDPKRPDLSFIPRSGGLFLDFNVHDFDMLRFITGSEVESVFAMGANLIDPAIGELGDIDSAIINIKMTNGALAMIDSSRETHYGYDQRVEVFGSKGNIVAGNRSASSTQLTTIDGVTSEKPYYSFVERYADAYRQQFAAFFDLVQQGGEVAVGLKDIELSVQSALAAQKSHQCGQPIDYKSLSLAAVG
ncbi:MAG: Gfo/Idh/MocA family oxidoreductase [Coxiellaceae bacterium]|nr:Gfo/Idh/MocA family oxidoreductase [Coxiellaceae bacterium]